MIAYRELSADDARSIGSIDRSEHIDGEYRVEAGALVLDVQDIDAPGWSDTAVAEYVARLTDLLSASGRAIGAWDDARLVGFASLDTAGVGGDLTLMLLDMLYVDRTHRGRGIGKALTERVADIARTLGATALYVSATPTRATVDAYLRMGAELIAAPDPVLLEREPDDIHLVLRLG